VGHLKKDFPPDSPRNKHEKEDCMSEDELTPESTSESTKKPRVLVTGATGFLGQRVIRDLAGSYEIIAAHHGGLEPSDNVQPVHWGASSASPEALVALSSPEVLIHLMALARTEACSQQPELAHRLNVEVAGRLAHVCCLRGIPMIFTSTDLVFDGSRGMYVEEDIPVPINTYARTKWEAEQLLSQKFADQPHLLTIFRIGLSYGWGDEAHPGPAGWVLNALRAGRSVQLFQDEFRSPIYQGDVSRAISDAFENKISGLFHLGGPERIDRYALGVLMAEKFGLDPALIQSGSVTEYQGPELRSADCSMDNSLFKKTFGWTPSTITEGLDRMASDAVHNQPEEQICAGANG